MKAIEHIKKLETEAQKFSQEGHATESNGADIYVAYEDVVSAIHRLRAAVESHEE